ncbi:hypothetical protein ABMS01_12020 [Lentilactobacillus parabuchneri]|uniref:hypothetical protein n=1 Tax=Lentilactobacillus parabuchneri TaxID=152331 RepID=UPI003862A9B0
MKKLLIILGMSSALILGFGWQQSTVQASDGYKARYTNPRSLRSHKYWYGYSNSYTGKWGYERIHFAKHSVYWAEKNYKSEGWTKSHIPAKRYFIKKAHNGWYSFGTRETDDVNYAKVDHRYLGNSKHVVLSIFDIYNDRGGYQVHAPYKVWDYTTHLKWAKGWYYKVHKTPW